MRKRIVFLCKNKLIGIDGILPILMELKSLYPGCKVMFAFLDDRHRDLIKSNYDLWRIVRSMEPDTYVINGGNKLVTLLRLLGFVAKALFKDNIIIKDGDTLPQYARVIKFLKMFSRVTEVKTYLVTMSEEGLRNLAVQFAVSDEKRGRQPESNFFNGCFDYFLSNFSAEQFRSYFRVEPPAEKMVQVGYTRKMPCWQRYMSESASRNPLLNGEPYFLFVLTCLEKYRSYFDEPEIIELLEESLLELKKHSARIKTVFKPHAITDMKRFRALLEKVGYSNYAIDYGHPMVLSSKARFVFGNFYSVTMFDAYYLGIPVVEYCRYDPEIFERMGKNSFGATCCDFFINRDRRKLGEVLGRLIEGQVKVSRDPEFIRRNFPDTPAAFYDFCERVFSPIKKTHILPKKEAIR